MAELFGAAGLRHIERAGSLSEAVDKAAALARDALARTGEPGSGPTGPIATVLLVWAGLTTPQTLAKARPYVFLMAFVVGMLLTPPDVISQTLLAIPVYLLYEAGIIMALSFGALHIVYALIILCRPPKGEEV